jgi:hypothetical protein
LEAVTLAPVEHAELTFQELSFAPLEIRAMELPALNAGSTPPSPR